MRKRFFAMLLFPGLICAQETVAPTTDERVGTVRGENSGDYNVVQSWEFGYRFATIGGNEGTYRSDVNFGNGIRLLGSSLTVNSRDGHGRWFDEIVLTTQGLGNDPYESATLHVDKNSLYEYDMTWRENSYFNPGLTIADGQHFMNTVYRWQAHDLTLLPQNWFRIRAGYSRVTNDGPALTTEHEFDPQGDVFPIFSNVRDQYNEYRLGGDIRRRGFRLTILRRWEYFKEDTTDSDTAPLFGNANPSDPSLLTGFARSQPYRGTTPGWMGNLFGERKWFTLNARVTYAGGRGAFVQNEIATGIDRFGASQNLQTVVIADGDRPVTTGEFTITLFPSSRFNLVNDTSITSTRISGNNAFEEFNNATFSSALVNFQYLGIRLITNSTDARYRLSRKLNFLAGFRYSDRQIRSIEDVTTPGSPFAGISAAQMNLLRAGVAGFNWLPLKNFQLHGEAEIGSNNNPFTPTGLGNYHAIQSKASYRTRKLTLGAGYQENYNNNSIVITAYSSHARNYSANVSWNPKTWMSLDASYSKLHLDTIGGIAYFAGTSFNTPLLPNQESIYISNIHAATLGMRFALGPRADLFVGYNLTKDTGDGRGSLLPQTTAAAQVFYNVQTYPLTYQTPLARLSIRINAKLRYNLGYQCYGYREVFGLLGYDQNYHAETGYTSLLWAF